MAGIYLHIPFCKRACSYCDFHFVTNLNQKNALLSAMENEIKLQRDFLPADAVINTIYFGGGTPSLLSESEIERILTLIARYFPVRTDPEITLECNPDDLTAEKARGLKAAGINRLSIGIQSFYDEHLIKLRRSHHSKQAFAAIENVQNAGFSNLTVDLMYGLPELSLSQWEKNLKRIESFGIPHLSAYNLTIEPGTPLERLVHKKRVMIPDDDYVLRQFDLLMDFAEQHNYEHYEISNFAQPGKRSRHNSNYWRGIPYAGLGPGAHSFNGTHRYFNPSNNRSYIQRLSNEQLFLTKEELTDNDRLNEFIMTRLRTIEGIPYDELESRFGSTARTQLEKAASAFTQSQHLRQKRTGIALTRTGKYVADHITASLFV